MSRCPFKRMVVCLAILVSVGLCAMYGGNSAAKAKGPEFAFVINRGKSKAPKLFLVGNFKAGVKITLLGLGYSQTCRAETTANKEMYGSGDITEITTSGRPQIDSRLALLDESVVDYSTVSGTVVTDSGKVKQIDGAVRKSNTLSSLCTRAQDAMPCAMKDLEGILPKIHHFTFPGIEMFVVSYDVEISLQNMKSRDTGPRVVVINNRVYPMSGWCSFYRFYVFRLNGQHYIQSGSRCCNCGMVVMELFRVTPAGVEEWLLDPSLST